MRRSRKIDKQERWIMDNLARGKIHQWMLWSTSRERRERQAGEAQKKRVKLT
jgi:hypothetical protein